MLGIFGYKIYPTQSRYQHYKLKSVTNMIQFWCKCNVLIGPQMKNRMTHSPQYDAEFHCDYSIQTKTNNDINQPFK
jgi:hypothetical protein